MLASEGRGQRHAEDDVSARIPSYVLGSWHYAASDGVCVRNAVTGEEVGRVSSDGIDTAAVLGYARELGGPALRALSFHQRADLLKRLAGHLTERKADTYALSACMGATRADSLIDVDGGITVLFVYASKGRKELPDASFLIDGGVENLSRGGNFVGQHVFTSLRGASIQINAYNFPVWQLLQKLATAVLAGVPTIVKPATPSGYITALAVRQIVESGVLPEGAVQLISGGIGDLFEHLDGQDQIAFTGSASTAARLRSHPCVTSRSVRFNAEADSLNCSILGPDAAAGSPEFALFAEQLTTEMVAKTGQKCTAIRRAFVPRPMLEAVCEAVSARLAEVVVGNPARDDVTMGPLVSLEQRAEVRNAVRQLASVARIVSGDPERVDPVDADPSRGAFLSPILLVADSAADDMLHTVEPFGPVSTIMPYEDADQVISAAARGQGSLAGSIVTHDAAFARTVLFGLAPWHGRILVLDRDDAPESTGHGSPLPHLVHGGPGRAGGGEEMGGTRGVLRHMQRTAVQASPAMLSAVTAS
jgi:oxepin-CoA hydrolase / 3-oxo-5,6-dehydrosuberyl-CoA semialdehyde dehydrogenase